jgi:hypothetical protein
MEKNKKMATHSSTMFECVVCLDAHSISLKSGCGHEFCPGCIQRTASECNENCPLCRTPLDANLLD